jgi:hypothetical protein
MAEKNGGVENAGDVGDVGDVTRWIFGFPVVKASGSSVSQGVSFEPLPGLPQDWRMVQKRDGPKIVNDRVLFSARRISFSINKVSTAKGHQM